MLTSRGEIWIVCLDPTVGKEINKSRPAVVVNNSNVGRLPLKIIVPITEWKDTYSQARWFVHLMPTENNGLAKESAADALQVRSVGESRLLHKIGELSQAEMNQDSKALMVCLDLP